MKAEIIVYQKPTCTKCRQTLNLLRESGKEFQAVNYYETRFTDSELRAVLKKLNCSARELLRRDEAMARTVGIRPQEMTDAELIPLMVQHPDLIQRPIVVRGGRAVVARPPEKVKALL
jgi:arsenate reductase